MLRPASLRDVLVGEGPEVVIGLPLLYGLSARQLSGVIAHAFAGYSREARLHGYPLLSSVDRWLFTQTGLGRLNALSQSDFDSRSRSRLDAIFKPWDVLVQGTFYLVYRVVSSMTFDVSRKVDMAGDLLSARIAGSTEFRSTQFRLRSLHYGQVNANQELVGSWRTKKLSDNFPALVVDHADTLQLSLRPRLIQEMEELVTPLTHSRIVDLGRIVNVEHTQEEGACFLLGAAISLLRDPAKVSKAVTLSHYRHIGIRHPDVYAAQKMQSIQKAEREKAKRHQVFLGLERSGRIFRVAVRCRRRHRLAYKNRLRAGAAWTLAQTCCIHLKWSTASRTCTLAPNCARRSRRCRRTPTASAARPARRCCPSRFGCATASTF